MTITRYLPASIKAPLKRWRTQAQSAWVQRFHAFSAEDLLAALRRVGIQPGDVVLAHTSYEQFAGFQGGIGDAIQMLQKAVAESGALLMPTMPFTGTAVDYALRGTITDLKKTPSRMGFLTEIFRRLPGVTRSVHPTHPVAGWGARATQLLQGHSAAATPCGTGSPFHNLLEADGKILLAGATIESITFYHCIEELLEPQLPVQPFTQRVYELQTRDESGVVHVTRTRLYESSVSRLRDCGILVAPLKERGFWRETRVGKLTLVVLRAREVLETVESMARAGVFCYVR